MHTPNDDIPLKMDHAGAWETSCMMYLRPDLVDLDELRKVSSEEQDELRMLEGPEGIGGKNPLKYASAEMGEKIVKGMADLIGRKAVEALRSLR